jgi:hypothetical protein
MVREQACKIWYMSTPLFVTDRFSFDRKLFF